MDPGLGANHLPWLTNFWQTQLQLIDHGELDFKNYSLPLARIKKVMKTDDDVKAMMISAEAPIVFAKACEIFILELTLRAWMHTDECKRRTLQRNDVAVAISRSDTFDFLIDIVPREDSKLKKADFGAGIMGDPSSYFYGTPAAMSMAMPFADPAALLYQQQQNYLQYQQAGGNPDVGDPEGLYPVAVEAQPAENEQ